MNTGNRVKVTGWKRGEGGEPVGAKTGAKGAVTVAVVFAAISAAFTAGMIGSNEVRAVAGEVMDVQNPAELLPLEEVIAKAKARHDGLLLEAALKSFNGRDVYEIEILDEGGKVWETYFDARSGEVMTLIKEQDGETTGR